MTTILRGLTVRAVLTGPGDLGDGPVGGDVAEAREPVGEGASAETCSRASGKPRISSVPGQGSVS